MRATVLLRRLAATLPVLLLVTVAVFAMIHLAPGDPVTALAGDQAVDPQVLASLRAQLRLDQPLPVQYALWIERLLAGDFGYSFATRQPVAQAIADRLAVTLQLTLFSLAIALVVAIPLGMLAAVFRGTAVDALNQGIAMVGGSMPAFWLGILLILAFAVELRWLPASGYVALSEDPLGTLRYLFLPALTLSAGYIAVLCRVVRGSVLEILAEDFVRTARAKGLGERAVLVGHVLRAALIPIVTIVAMEASHLLGGAVVTETIFALPGMGRLLVDAVSSRDFPIVQAATLVMALLLVAANLLADLAYNVVDPRVGQE